MNGITLTLLEQKKLEPADHRQVDFWGGNLLWYVSALFSSAADPPDQKSTDRTDIRRPTETIELISCLGLGPCPIRHVNR